MFISTEFRCTSNFSPSRFFIMALSKPASFFTFWFFWARPRSWLFLPFLSFFGWVRDWFTYLQKYSKDRSLLLRKIKAYFFFQFKKFNSNTSNEQNYLEMSFDSWIVLLWMWLFLKVRLHWVFEFIWVKYTDASSIHKSEWKLNKSYLL